MLEISIFLKNVGNNIKRKENMKLYLFLFLTKTPSQPADIFLNSYNVRKYHKTRRKQETSYFFLFVDNLPHPPEILFF